MLAAGAAEAIERVARHVIAALHRNLLDRVRHVLDRDPDEAVGNLLGFSVAADFLRKRREAFAHGFVVERLVLSGTENVRKEFRDEFPRHHIRIGDGERSAAAIACRSRIGAGRVRADAKACAVEMQDRTAAGSDGVNAHHRRAHAHARDLGLERALVFAVEMRHVGRGAAHVEADYARKACFARGLRHRHHAAGGAGQDRVLALEQIGGGEPARGHHEHEARLRVASVKIFRNLPDISPQDRRQIRIHHRRVAAADQLDQRRDLVADRHLREDFARQRRDLLFMFGKAIGMHEHDRDRVDAVGVGTPQLWFDGGKIGRILDAAVGAHPLVDLDHALEQHVGLDDFLGEDFRPRLIADAERVAETFGRDQERALALALEQGIGRDRRAHFHRTDAAGRDWRRPEPGFRQVTDALHSGVAIGLRILGQQLVRDQVAVRACRPTMSVKVPPRSIQKSQLSLPKACFVMTLALVPDRAMMN